MSSSVWSYVRVVWILLYAFSMLWLFGACPATTPGEEKKAEGIAQERSAVDAMEAIVADAPTPREPVVERPSVPERASDNASSDATSPDAAASVPPIVNKVEQARYQKDLIFLSKPRTPGTDHWKASQDLCAARFKEYGFEVELHAFGTGVSAGVNVIGVKKGTTAPDERVLISAHYDSVPNCDGADDNATGVAGVLEAARVLGAGTYPRTLVVACWDREEAGLLGSRAYAKRAAERKENIKMHFVFEMLGFFSDTPKSQTLPQGLNLLFPKEFKVIQDNEFRADFIALIGDTGAQASGLRMAAIAAQLKHKAISLTVPDGLKNSPLVRDLRRSDHAPFWANDVPAMMITDTSEFRYKPYHCRNQLKDTYDKLNADFATKTIQITVGAVSELLSAE